MLIQCDASEQYKCLAKTISPEYVDGFEFEKKIGSFGRSKFEKEKTAQFSKLLGDLPHLFFSGITFLFWGDCLKFVSTPYIHQTWKSVGGGSQLQSDSYMSW